MDSKSLSVMPGVGLLSRAKTPPMATSRPKLPSRAHPQRDPPAFPGDRALRLLTLGNWLGSYRFRARRARAGELDDGRPHLSQLFGGTFITTAAMTCSAATHDC